MTNYNDGKWHGWNGGECPVHPKTVVEVLWAGNGKSKASTVAARHGAWSGGSHGLRAFRVVKEYREPPKEYTIDPRKNFIWYSCEDDLVHVREVLP